MPSPVHYLVQQSPQQGPAGLSPAAWFRYGIGLTDAGGGLCSQWNDQSGNGRHLKQATATNQPAIQTDGSVLFDGVDNFMKCDAFTLNQPETVYVLGKWVVWASDARWIDGDGSSTGMFQGITATPQIRVATGAGSTAIVSPTVGAYVVLAGVFNGASSLIQLNSGAPATGDAVDRYAQGLISTNPIGH